MFVTEGRTLMDIPAECSTTRKEWTKVSKEEGGRKSSECGHWVCRNGGECVSPELGVCACAGGLRGLHCSHDPCRLACLNNGVCRLPTVASSASLFEHSLASQPSCLCPLEYSGPRCERFKCTAFCSSHGRCSVSNESGLPFCTCDIGWTGTRCQTKVRLSRKQEKSVQKETCKDFCFNGGHCSEAAGGEPLCVCPERYGGRRCENCMTDSGKPLACLNGGRCHKRTACICEPGWGGSHCEVDLCLGLSLPLLRVS